MTIVVEGSPFGNGSTTWYLALDPHPQTYDWPTIGFWPTISWHIPPTLMLVKGPNSCWLKGPRFWWKIPISDGWIASNPKFLYGNTVTWFNMVEHPATQLLMVSTIPLFCLLEPSPCPKNDLSAALDAHQDPTPRVLPCLLAGPSDIQRRFTLRLRHGLFTVQAVSIARNG